MNSKNLLAGALTGLWIVLAAGCGGSSSSGDDAPTQAPTPPPPVANHAVGGSVFGLHGTLVLANNSGDALTLTADGPFAFTTTLASGTAYAVSVQTQPADQICTVDNGSGSIADADVTDVTVNCSTITRIVGGAVSGLNPSESVVLQNNGADNLALNDNGDFAFATPVAQSGAYNVTVLTQPATQTCSIANGIGTAGATDIDDVQVTCSTNAYTVRGTVSGLSGSVTIQNNGADDLTIPSDGSFTFSAPVAQGAAYNVTVSTQPATQTCVVTNGSGTMGGANVANVGLNCTTNTTTLSASVSELALSVTGLTEHGIAGTPSSGLARKITITNTGSYDALNLAVGAPTWPSGTTSFTNCGSTLLAGQTCDITVTPGSVASSDGTNPCSITGTAPLPGTVQVSADNTNTVSTDAVVLNYGCIYQGGYVYAFDDTVANTQSVGGKVAATTDQVSPLSGVIWSSDGSGGAGPSVVNDNIYGTGEDSTTSSASPSVGFVAGQVACDGSTDGACNTHNIYTYYQNFAPGAPINTAYYAAGLCKQTISTYSDWYLPAICEMGHGGLCGPGVSPRLQNMQTNLVESGTLLSLSIYHWSSTSVSVSPGNAWFQYFDMVMGGLSSQQKAEQMGVRCSRAF